MPIIPFAAAAGAALGTSAAVGGTIIAGTALAGGLAVANSIQTAAANKAAAKAANAASNANPDLSQIVGDPTQNQTSNANNLGRAALISTSPSGVLGNDPTGRRKLLGNDG